MKRFFTPPQFVCLLKSLVGVSFSNTCSYALQCELLVDECLEEASKAMEITARFNIPYNSHECLWIDQFLKRDIIESQLS